MTKAELIALGISEENADKITKAMVPYARFTQVNDELKDLKSQVADRDKSIGELGSKLKMGEDAAKTIASLQDALKAKDAAILQTRRDSAIQLALKDAKAKNAKAALALLDTNKLELQEDGTIKGLSDALEGLKKTDAYLFDTGTPPPPPPSQPGFNPPPAGAPTSEREAIISQLYPKK